MQKSWKRLLKIISLGLFSLLVVLLVLINVLVKNLIKDEADMLKGLNAAGQLQTLEVGYIDVESLGKIRYAHLGVDTLPLLVLVHGSPGDLNAFDSWFADTLLTQKFQLVAFDRPGFGLSKVGVQRALSDQSLCVSAIIDHISAPSYYLLGHSYGGAVVLTASMDEVENVKRSIIVAGSVDPALEPREWWRPIISNKLVSWTLPDMLLCSNKEIEALYGELVNMDARIDTIDHMPITVFQGTQDKLVPPGNADYIKAKLPRSELVWFENEGHFILWSKQKEIVEYLLNHSND